MEEYTNLIIIIMTLCIIVTLIATLLLRHREVLKERQQFEVFKKNRDIDIHNIHNDKGVFGEFSVFKLFDEYFDDHTIIFNNVEIPKIKGDPAEADLIVINERAIFVVEVKNLYGIITGDRDEKDWNQKLNENLSHPLYNPIIQNKNHIKHLKRNLDISKYNLSDDNIYSLIVFGKQSNISEVRYNDKNTKVVNINELKHTVDLIINSNDVRLTNNQIKEISDTIEQFKEKISKVID